ncbi:MAG: thioredoxin [Candidatus Cloacimonadota bacterium]|nr:MAG: thioredoxin [Candidatus Cloacimonadota bacterium]
MSVGVITQDNFDEIVDNSKAPVLVDFWAEWCGPCKMLIPVLEELSSEYGDDLTIYKANVEENPKLAQKFKVRSIPCLILFKDGEAIKTIVGALAKDDLKAKIDNSLS